jgi:hypothetical protein
MRAGSAAAAAGILLLLAASPAAAEELGTSGQFTYVSGTATIAGGVMAISGRAQAGCPAGMVAIGGGGKLADGSTGSIVSSSFNDAGWFMDAWHQAPAAENLTSYGICVGDSSKIHTRTNARHEPADRESYAVPVRCRAGGITGGGMKVSGDPTGWIVDRSFPGAGQDAHGGGADAWSTFAAHTIATAEAIKATVVCMRGIDSVRAKARVSRDTPGPVTKVIGCPNGTVVTGGGYISFGASGVGRVTGSTPVDTARDADSIPDDAWRIDAFDTLGGTKFEVRAVCV